MKDILLPASLALPQNCKIHGSKRPAFVIGQMFARIVTVRNFGRACPTFHTWVFLVVGCKHSYYERELQRSESAFKAKSWIHRMQCAKPNNCSQRQTDHNRVVGNDHFCDTTERASQRLFCSYKGGFPCITEVGFSPLIPQPLTKTTRGAKPFFPQLTKGADHEGSCSLSNRADHLLIK